MLLSIYNYGRLILYFYDSYFFLKSYSCVSVFTLFDAFQLGVSVAFRLGYF